MILTFHTQHFFKLQAGETVIALNPLAPETGQKISKFGSDVSMACYFDGNMEMFDSATYGDNEPVALYGPGEYEIDGMQVNGFDVVLEGEHHTIYTFKFDNMKVAVLGAVDQKKALTPDAMEAMDTADIMFVPATEAGFELATAYSPKIIIPTGYDNVKEITEFTETLSSDQIAQVDRLTIKEKDIEALQSFAYVFTA